MKKLSILFIFLLIVFVLVSCNKYLDKKSNASFVVPSTVEDLQALLDLPETMNFVTSSYMIASSDDYFLVDARYNSQVPNEQKIYRWEPFDYFFPNDWSAQYYVIYESNVCLERLNTIPKTTINSIKWDNVKGSALFYRAYYFLDLAWAYSKGYDESTATQDLGIPLRLSSDFNIPSQRATLQETYTRLISDAKESMQYLPQNSQHVLRPSKVAAYGLLARAYLSMRLYDSAWKYADLCLSVKNSLINLNQNSADFNSSATLPFTQFNSETIFYSQPNNNFTALHAGSGTLVDTLLYSSYDKNDLRRSLFSLGTGVNSGYYRYNGNYTGTGSRFSGIAVDEMYLTRAECSARLGNKDAALADLNLLLSKKWKSGSFSPITAPSSQAALDIILAERRKELLLRGLRWIDIKRLNKEGGNIVPKRKISGQIYSIEPNSNKYTLPLPKDIIDQTGMLQNPT